MNEDAPILRKRLSALWQRLGVDAVRRGVRPEAVFETMLLVGLAGYVELRGKEAAARTLAAVAGQLSEQARAEAEAMSEASRATMN